MRPFLILGVLLMVLGVGVLAYPAITYTSEEKVLDIGPFEATAETEETIPLHPALGGAALVVGGLLLIAGLRKSV